MRRVILVLCIAVAATLVPVGTAAATSCRPEQEGRVGIDPAHSRTHFVFAGNGWGHGVGMSQYGAQGAARLGCSVTDILTTYYRGVDIGRRDTSMNIRVGLAPDNPGAALARSATLHNQSDDALTWKLGASRVASQPGGARWRVVVEDSGAYRLLDLRTDPPREVWRGGSPQNSLKLHLDGRVVRYEEEGRRYRRGTFEFRSERRSSGTGMYVTADVPSIEAYLYGLAEMPSSFPIAALQSQAIVGRSFALKLRGSNRANCRCHVYDSTASQVYAGYEKEAEGTDAVYGRRWVQAVNDTAGKVMLHDGSVATGNYSSSAGGTTESAAFVWGGGAPYLRSVDATHWNLASDDPNRHWEARFTRQELGRRFGVGLALEVRLPGPHGPSGRVGDPARGAGGMVVIGTQGRVTVSGEEARQILGTSTLKSALFRATSPPSPIFTGRSIVGDWDGDGVDEPGWHDDGTFYLRMDRYDIVSFRFGSDDDVPVVGDWDGDGVDTVGVVRGNRWYLRNRHARGNAHADVAFRFGSADDRVAAGDWDGDGTDTAAVIRGNRWFLVNRHGATKADVAFRYGSAGDRPVVGDWTGSGVDRAGVVRGNRWLLRTTRAPHAGRDYRYGSHGDSQVVGDWDGDGSTTAGIIRGARWYLANRHGARSADVVLDTSGR